MAVDLHQLNILVTRPDPAGSELCQLINARGGHAYHFPTLSIQAQAKTPLFQKEIKKLDKQDWLIFISPQSVYSSQDEIKNNWPKLPDSLKLVAVGESTKSALLKAGYSSVICPKDWSSEGLLNLAEFQNVTDKKIAIVRGEDGRVLLAETLEARGAEITHLIAYKRVLSHVDVQPYVKLLKQNQIGAIVCASFQAVYNLKELMGDAVWLDLKKKPLVVVSPRIKALADEMGFQTIWVARNASHSEVIKILGKIARECGAGRRTEG